MRKLESEIQKRLYELQDLDYRAFQAKLTPDLKLEDFIGVRTPALRSLAKEVGKREDVKDFLQALPHSYFDENQIHAFLISEMKDYGEVILYLNDFLPYVNNWATCDQLRPKCFKNPSVNFVFPAPNSPDKTTTSPIFNLFANSDAKSIVSSLL